MWKTKLSSLELKIMGENALLAQNRAKAGHKKILGGVYGFSNNNSCWLEVCLEWHYVQIRFITLIPRWPSGFPAKQELLFSQQYSVCLWKDTITDIVCWVELHFQHIVDTDMQIICGLCGSLIASTSGRPFWTISARHGSFTRGWSLRQSWGRSSSDWTMWSVCQLTSWLTFSYRIETYRWDRQVSLNTKSI